MKIIKKLALFLILGVICAMLFACNQNAYKLDLGEQAMFFENAKDSYKEGENVNLKFSLIATDTDYSFYLNGEKIDYSYEDGAFVINFTMPNHNVKLTYETRNSMVYEYDGE